MTRISLRPATRGDYDFLWWLHRVTMRPYVEATWGWDEAWQSHYFQQHFDPASRDIIEADGVTVGCISAERHEERIFLAVIEIAPDYQNRGIATTLIRALLDEGDRTALPVELSVLKANPARRLYERLGFSMVGETGSHIVMRRTPHGRDRGV